MTDWTAEAARYDAGASLETIALDAGVGPQTARAHLVAAGATIRPRGGGGRRTAEHVDWADMRRFYESGATLAVVAQRAGVSRRFARERLVEAGTTIRHGRAPARYTNSRYAAPTVRIVRPSVRRQYG